MSIRRAVVLGLGLWAACSGESRAPCPDADGRPPAPHGSPESAWLAEVGQGPAQTSRVCARGEGDPVAAALCRSPEPRLTGLGELQQLLGLAGPDLRFVGLAGHSAALPARIVSALNPRLVVSGLVGPGGGSQADQPTVSMAFVRGEPFVELAGLDRTTGRLNFYLLAFAPACEATSCTAADLLGPSIEEGWLSWTLYQDRDLANTALDCLSCHQPGGPSRPRRLLMRQVRAPWMHWFPSEPTVLECPADGVAGPRYIEYAESELWRIFERAQRGAARYGGVRIEELGRLPGGHDAASFLAVYEARVDAVGKDTVSEPHPFPTRELLGARACGPPGAAEALYATYRRSLLERGLPVPFHSPDVLSASARGESRDARKERLSREEGRRSFALAAAALAPEVAVAAGFVPESDAPAERLLQQHCLRCHDGTSDPALSRSRFDAAVLSRTSADARREAMRRIELDPDDPRVMPPRRFGELPPWAVARLRDLLSSRP